MNKKEFYQRLTQGLKVTAKIRGIENLKINKIVNPDFDLHVSIPFTKLSTYGNSVMVKIDRNVITLQFNRAVDKKYINNQSYESKNKTIDYRYSYKANMVILTENEILDFLLKEYN